MIGEKRLFKGSPFHHLKKKKNPHSTIIFFLNPFKKWVFKKVFIFQNFFRTMPDLILYEKFKGLVTTTQKFFKDSKSKHLFG